MRTVSRLKQTLKETARATRRAARASDSAQVNVAVRKNMRVAGNVGHHGGVEYAAAKQDAPIVQRGSWNQNSDLE
jgi:hypothetical protein